MLATMTIYVPFNKYYAYKYTIARAIFNVFQTYLWHEFKKKNNINKKFQWFVFVFVLGKQILKHRKTPCSLRVEFELSFQEQFLQINKLEFNILQLHGRANQIEKYVSYTSVYIKATKAESY